MVSLFQINGGNTRLSISKDSNRQARSARYQSGSKQARIQANRGNRRQIVPQIAEDFSNWAARNSYKGATSYRSLRAPKLSQSFSADAYSGDHDQPRPNVAILILRPKRCTGAYFARRQTRRAVPVPVDGVAVLTVSSSSPEMLNVTLRSVPFQFGNVQLSMWVVIVLSASFTVEVPK
jgi:hypothetical protein